MKHALFVILGGLIALPEIASAMIALPPLEERVRNAEVIVVGTVKRTKGDETWQTGHIVVERVLKGGAKAGEKLPARWKSPPKKAKDPKQPQLPDYTFRPALDVRQIILLQPRKEAKEAHTLNWGSTERLEDEKKVQDALKAKTKQASVREVQLAVEKGLFYVEQTAIRWWEKKKCSSCHEGPMLLFSHNIAKRQGFPIDQKKLDFWTEKWVLTDGLVSDRKSDGRKDAGGMLGAPLTMLFRDLEADGDPKRAESLGKLMQIAGKDWQLDDGNWDIKVRVDYRPWILLALKSYEKSGMPLGDAVRQEIIERRERTERWISESKMAMPEKTEDLAAWVVYTHRPGTDSGESVLLRELLDRRRDDGFWGIDRKFEFEHQLVTAAVLFALTSIGRDTTDPVVAETQRLLLDLQQEDGRWAEGGRIFDKEGAEIENSVYNMWTTAWACAALAQTIEKLPPGTTRLFVPEPEKVKEIDSLALKAADGYVGVRAADTKMDVKMEEAK